MKPHILITNDDGIHAKGIKHLYQALCGVADLSIVAPAVEKSGSSLAITLHHPLQIHEVPWEKNVPAWSVSGTPADCVKMALRCLIKKAPDFILSGINRGTNAGRNVLYSGTIGGVIEGVFRGIPGIAFSCEDPNEPNYALFEQYIPQILNYFLKHPVSHGSFINVTFPEDVKQGVQGIKLAKQGREYWLENPDQRMNPAGQTYYWLGGKKALFDEETESDIVLLKKGFITAVPIHVGELTDHQFMHKHKETFDRSFEKQFGKDSSPEEVFGGVSLKKG